MNNSHKDLSCAHTDSLPLYSLGDYTLSRCNNCGLIKTLPVPGAEKIAGFYNSGFYTVGGSQRFSAIVEKIIRIFRFFRAWEVSRLSHAPRVLDVGCGRGLMLYYLKKYFGASYVIGTQYSLNSIEYIQNKLGVEVKSGELEDHLSEIKPGLDVICFWHVLEHIDDVRKYLRLTRGLLKKDGALVIQVPNTESFSRKISGRTWLGWDIPLHLTHFTPTSLAELIKEEGFRIIKKRYFSLEYSVFITVESIINRLTGTDNLLYKRLLLSDRCPEMDWRILPHVLLAIILFVPAVILNIFFSGVRKGEIIHYIARKNT